MSRWGARAAVWIARGLAAAALVTLAFWGGRRVAAHRAAAAQEALVQRGEYLFASAALCAWCHSPGSEDGEPEAVQAAVGGRRFEDCWGVTYSTNLTSHPTDGLGAWSDEQILFAIRDGVRPDGSSLAPPHPWQLYMGMADEDLEALITYLRTLPPAPGRWPEPQLVARPPDFVPPPTVPPGPPRAPRDPDGLGSYLALSVSTCVMCHTPRTPECTPVIERALAGGLTRRGPWGAVVSPNISNHPTDGLGAWRDEEIVRAITRGMSRDGRALSAAMPWRSFAGLESSDLAAIVRYLRRAEPMPGRGRGPEGTPPGGTPP